MSIHGKCRDLAQLIKRALEEEAASPGAGPPARAQGCQPGSNKRHLNVADGDTVTMTQESEWWLAQRNAGQIQQYVDSWRGPQLSRVGGWW